MLIRLVDFLETYFEGIPRKDWVWFGIRLLDIVKPPFSSRSCLKNWRVYYYLSLCVGYGSILAGP